MLTTLILGAAAAWACSVAVPGEFVLDTTVEDNNPPVLEAKTTTISVSRGVGPVCYADGSSSSTSCDDIGQISVSITAAVDAEAPVMEPSTTLQVQEGVGYLLRVVSGDLPEGLTLSGTPQAAFFAEGQVSLPLVWIDEAEDEQEALGFVLGIQAIDLAGNLSEELLIDISDPGRDAGEGSCGGTGKSAGCAAAAVGDGGALGLILLAGVGGLGRRRQAITARRAAPGVCGTDGHGHDRAGPR